jgi:nitroreductase
MKSLMEIIKVRKSIRAYRDEPLPQEIVDTILEAGQHAPSARNLQPLEYRVITNKALINRLSDSIVKAVRSDPNAPPPPRGLPPNLGFFYGAPLLIIIIAPEDNHFAVSDGALAAQNIMLCAASLDLGSCFIGMARFIKKDPEVCQEIHIPDNMNIVATIICGYPAEDPQPKQKRLNAEYFK